MFEKSFRELPSIVARIAGALDDLYLSIEKMDDDRFILRNNGISLTYSPGTGFMIRPEPGTLPDRAATGHQKIGLSSAIQRFSDRIDGLPEILGGLLEKSPPGDALSFEIKSQRSKNNPVFPTMVYHVNLFGLPILPCRLPPEDAVLRLCRFIEGIASIPDPDTTANPGPAGIGGTVSCLAEHRIRAVFRKTPTDMSRRRISWLNEGVDVKFGCLTQIKDIAHVWLSVLLGPDALNDTSIEISSSARIVQDASFSGDPDTFHSFERHTVKNA